MNDPRDNVEELLEVLEKIRLDGPYSKKELSDLIGIAYNTLERLRDEERPVLHRTIRKIKNFIKDYRSKNDRV